MNDATRLQRLEDREALRDLLARYCYLIARGDVDGVIELFTADCRVEILGQLYSGEAGLRELYRDALLVQPKPYIHNHLIETLEDTSATSSCVLEIRQQRDGTEQVGGGCYEDRYRKQDGRWKFHQRVFRSY